MCHSIHLIMWVDIFLLTNLIWYLYAYFVAVIYISLVYAKCIFSTYFPV